MLKNYTSTISADRSILYIERKLAQLGARQILKEYNNEGHVEGMCFSMPINGSDMHFKLPSKIAACEKVLRLNVSQRIRPETLKKIPAQAERTAWKILADWIDVEMARIELDQIEIIEMFLPNVYNPVTKETFFEQIKSRNYKALLPAGSSKCQGGSK